MKQEHISRLEQQVSSGQDLNKKQALCLKSKDIFDAIVNELERLLNPIDKQGNKVLSQFFLACTQVKFLILSILMSCKLYVLAVTGC